MQGDTTFEKVYAGLTKYIGVPYATRVPWVENPALDVH
jgi:hypothetical protein